MQAYRKVIALFLCTLILIFSGATYIVSRETSDLFHQGESKAAFVNSNDLNHFFIFQEKSSSESSPAWKSAVSIPGLFLHSPEKPPVPGLTLIRKIYVVNTDYSFACKGFLLFPYHEFL